MQLSAIGLDYVGAVAAGCLADQGHEVIAVDPDADKVATIRREPFYTKTWFIVVTGVAAVGLGALIGYQIGKVDVIDCGTGADPRC